LTPARSSRAVGAIVGLVLLAWALWTWWPSEERRIRRRLDQLAETASVPAGEPPIARLARAAQVGRFFTEDLVIDLGPASAPIRGRAALVALASRFVPPPEGARVAFVDVAVTVAPGGETATVALTATGSMVDRVSGEKVVEARELEFGLRKLEGEWLVATVKAVSPLLRPGADPGR
jgi:hypothetical protein